MLLHMYNKNLIFLSLCFWFCRYLEIYRLLTRKNWWTWSWWRLLR